MAEQERLSTLTLAILCLVAYEPDSAYGLRRAFMTTPMGHFSASPGAVYPALRRMEADRWVKGRKANSDTLRPKRVYEITERGMRVLTGRMRSQVTRDDVVWHLDDLLLRFAFMGRFLESEEVLAFLEQFESETKAYLTHLRKLHESVAEHLGTCEGLALEHGMASYKTNLDWSRRAIKQITSRAAKKRSGGR